MLSLRVCTVLLALVCVVTAIHQVKQQGSKYKIEKITDITLKNALESIRSSAWNVKELDLSGNLLSKISANDLAPFTNLELLNVSSNVVYETWSAGLRVAIPRSPHAPPTNHASSSRGVLKSTNTSRPSPSTVRRRWKALRRPSVTESHPVQNLSPSTITST
ncbi:uncharacterized protein LOC126563183 [Anopheles maculipalpis]|uniref:uncharacterized protein LOC126563183 n=1 Tax=Anopheles maculipalpis TaxID=1496333 RepID=UPI0021599D8C|nr:uncharacterized protein LOC126563183 [Anopheles maculipalpis]